MSPSASRAPLGLLGNPENRRILAFQEAVEQAGWPRPPCLSYLECLRDPEALDRFPAERLRIDSPGENAEVAAELIALGGGPAQAPVEFGEIAYSREYHVGFCRLLQRVRHPCLNPPADIARMFDKWECHQLFVERGVARPPAHRAPSTWAEFHEWMRRKRSGQAFLKPLHGSSASGVCAVRWTPSRLQLLAPLKIHGSRLVNSLRMQRYTDGEAVLQPLLQAGMICEQWIPKLTLEDGAVDLRVLVVAGEARHWVVRQSRHPMTNLHLGNRRGDPLRLQSQLGEERLQAAFRLAERAAGCFPQSLSAGVDILLDHRGRALVGEINAFGDLLPGVVHRGQSPYTAIAEACYAQRCAV